VEGILPFLLPLATAKRGADDWPDTSRTGLPGTVDGGYVFAAAPCLPAGSVSAGTPRLGQRIGKPARTDHDRQHHYQQCHSLLQHVHAPSTFALPDPRAGWVMYLVFRPGRRLLNAS